MEGFLKNAKNLTEAAIINKFKDVSLLLFDVLRGLGVEKQMFRLIQEVGNETMRKISRRQKIEGG